MTIQPTAMISDTSPNPTQQDPSEALEEGLVVWKTVELRSFLGTTLLSLIALAVAFGIGFGAWGVGWLFGQLLVCINLFVLARLYESAVRGSLPKLVTGIFALIKMGLFMGLIWFGLKYLPAHPIGFFLGFTSALSGLVLSIVLWGRQRDEEGSFEPLSSIDLDHNDPLSQETQDPFYTAPDDTLFQRHHEPTSEPSRSSHGSKDGTL